jgi:hypothetical protein
MDRRNIVSTVVYRRFAVLVRIQELKILTVLREAAASGPGARNARTRDHRRNALPKSPDAAFGPTGYDADMTRRFDRKISSPVQR